MKHLLSTRDLSLVDAIELLDTTERMAETQQREIKKLPTLRGRTVVNLFFEDSTRTRISFEAAAKRLSADVINFAAKGSSVTKGESLLDTAKTLQAMGADAVVIRHWASGAPHLLAESSDINQHIVNAGDGKHEHPTQALLDAFTMRRRLAKHLGHPAPDGTDLSGAHVVIVGDILHSRVARSNIWLLATLGAKVTVVAPPTLLPVGVESWPCEVSYDLNAVIAGQGPHGSRGGRPDVIMMLRVQRERMSGRDGFFPSEREYSRLYGFDDARMGKLDSHALIMHPGPMNRGLEISSAAADSAQSTIVEQVTNGVSVRMAVLYHLLAGQA